MKKLRKLELAFDNDYNDDDDDDDESDVHEYHFGSEDRDFKQVLIEAVKRNGSLRNIECCWELTRVSSFDGDEQRALDNCITRNEGMDAVADKSVTLHHGHMPHALVRGWETGPDKVFQAMVAFSPKAVSSKSKRKRKRPDLYAP